MTTLTNVAVTGWYEITSEGIGTIYFAIADEGMTTGPSDTPANTQYKPRILNPQDFSISRSPSVWMQGQSSVGGAAIGQLVIDNYDGAYNFLIDNDVRDSVVVIKVLPASALLTGTSMADAPTICTAIIDDVEAPTRDQITVTLKDTLARLDRVLPVRYNPPFVDEGAANVMIPLTFGAVRNVKPLLVDSANRLFQLHDSSIPNVTLVADNAAPLDPYADPPQYTPALSGTGLQLESMPVGLLTVDCSSYGVQSIIPGADDVLANSGGSYGDFSGWSSSPNRPDGWEWSNLSGSVARVNNYLHSGFTAAVLTTERAWVRGGSRGDYLHFPDILQGGRSYRLNFSVANIQVWASTNPANLGGLIVATDVTDDPRDYIAGYGAPINGIGTYPNPPSQNLSFEFTVPPGSSRDLYFIVTATKNGTTPVGTCSLALYHVTLELLGQYPSLPLSGIPFSDYCTEILVHRAGEESTVFNASEAEAITLADDGALIPMGIHFDSPPNILGQCLRPWLDARNATTFTDHLGTLRFRRFTDPTDPSAEIIADFGPGNIESVISVETDRAEGLTTVIGARPNETVFSAADFVTDQLVVPQDTKTKFSRASQFLRTSSKSPAGQYNFAIGAPEFNSIHDDPEFAQDTIDEAVGIYSPTVYSNATFTNGKRRKVKFIAHYDDLTKVGLTTTCDVRDLIYGEFISLTATNADTSERFVNQQAEIIEWAIYPFAQKLELTVEF